MASSPRHGVVIVEVDVAGRTVLAARPDGGRIALLTGSRDRIGAVLTGAVTVARNSRRERTSTTRQIGSLHDLYASSTAPDQQTVAS